MIAENQKVELFDEFYNWLVADGLKAKKSERLHRKKIFASLLANEEMTLENFKDFLSDKKEDEKRTLIKRIENLTGEIIFYKNENIYIQKVEIKLEEKEFFICFDTRVMKLNFSQLEEIEKLIRKDNSF